MYRDSNLMNDKLYAVCFHHPLLDDDKRLGVLGLELYAEPMYAGVEYPERDPGRRLFAQTGESMGVAGRELCCD